MIIYRKNIILGLLTLSVILLTGFGCTRETINQPQSKKQTPVSQKEEVIPNKAQINWKTFTDQQYRYEFQYPEGWNFGDKNNDPNMYNVIIWKDDGLGKDNIQIGKVTYGTNADGSKTNRETYLKMLETDEYTKINLNGGKGYYIKGESKGGPVPTIYLVSNTGDEILVMNYNIFDSPLEDAELLFKQIIRTFRFL